MPYPEPIVGAIIVNDKGQVLLVTSPKWPGLYVIPGGHVELGESMVDAVRREVKEEVGLEVISSNQNLVHESVFGLDRKKSHFIFIDFVCKCKNYEVKIDNEEISGFVWKMPDEAVKLNVSPSTRKTIEVYASKKLD